MYISIQRGLKPDYSQRRISDAVELERVFGGSLHAYPFLGTFLSTSRFNPCLSYQDVISMAREQFVRDEDTEEYGLCVS